MSPRTRKISRAGFGLLLLALTILAYFIPYYDWDLVAYVGSAITLREHDSKLIQQQAYTELRNELPEDDYSDIATGSDFRRDVAQNAQHFRQQLRFYQIRPLYIWSLAGLHASRIGYVEATRLLSVVSFALIGVLLQFWLRRHVGEMQAYICVLLLLITPVLFTSARTGSPDALSAFVVLLGTYFLIEHNAPIVGSALLLISLLLRTDNVVYVFIVCTVAAALRTSEKKARVIPAIAAIAAIGIVLTINHTEHSYPWPVLMQNTTTPIVNPAEVSPKISVSDYFADVHDMIDEARENSVTVFPFIAALALFALQTPSKLKRLVKIVLLSWAAHLVLYPHIEDRYFIAGAAMIGVAAVAGMHEATSPSVANQ